MNYINEQHDNAQVRLLKMTNEVKKFPNIYLEIDNNSEIISICSYCNNLRNSEGEWTKNLYPYSSSSNILLSHGICPSCAKIHFPKEYELAIQRDILPS